MPVFLETVELQFGTRDLYKVLGVEKDAAEVELRRAYRRLSLRVHPDRANPDEVDVATEKFQVSIICYSRTHIVVNHALTDTGKDLFSADG